MATIYVLQDRDDESSGDNSQGLAGGNGGVNLKVGKNDSNSPSVVTNEPVTSNISTFTTTVEPHQSTMSSSRSPPAVASTDQSRSQSTGVQQPRAKTTTEVDGNFHST